MIDDPLKMISFPFFPWDFFRDTEHLDDSQKMKYLRLLSHMYLRGGYLPDDEKVLARLAGVSIKQWRRWRFVSISESDGTSCPAKSGTQCPHLMLDMMSLHPEGWTQKKVLRELGLYQGRRERSEQMNGVRWSRDEAVSCQNELSITPPSHNPQPIDLPDRANTVDLDPTGKERGHRASAGPDSSFLDDCVEEIFGLLRTKTGRQFQTKRNDGKPTTGALLVRRRLMEGNKADDMKAMVAMKCNEWMGGPMESNLRPGVLFGEKNFDDYIGLLFGGIDDD